MATVCAEWMLSTYEFTYSSYVLKFVNGSGHEMIACYSSYKLELHEEGEVK